MGPPEVTFQKTVNQRLTTKSIFDVDENVTSRTKPKRTRDGTKDQISSRNRVRNQEPITDRKYREYVSEPCIPLNKHLFHCKEQTYRRQWLRLEGFVWLELESLLWNKTGSQVKTFNQYPGVTKSKVEVGSTPKMKRESLRTQNFTSGPKVLRIKISNRKLSRKSKFLHLLLRKRTKGLYRILRDSLLRYLVRSLYFFLSFISYNYQKLYKKMSLVLSFYTK